MAHDRERPGALVRANADVAVGRTWNAANRLQSYLSTNPGAAEVRLRLAQLLLDMGAPTDAGGVLLASERDDEIARAAIASWLSHLDADPLPALRALQGQGLLVADALDDLGPIGRSRVEPLVARARERLASDADETEREQSESPMSRAASAGCSLGCGAFILVIVAGIVQIAEWLGL
jgi:Tetratricopeptide repeat